jgi:dCTP deaminase
MWSDNDIRRELKNGSITIEPFDEQSVQPASVDFRLGGIFYEFNPYHEKNVVIDTRKNNLHLMRRFESTEIEIMPGKFILGSTIERISLSNNVVSRIEGKSSLGRLGLTVHSTAGFIDPGNQDLSITLELFNQSPHPIRLYKGMWICQLSFQWTDSPCLIPYGVKRGSRYFGDHEPVPSKVELNHGVES